METGLAAVENDQTAVEATVAAIPEFTDSRYLQLTGGNLTGDLVVGGDVVALGRVQGNVQVLASAASATTVGLLRWSPSTNKLEVSDGTMWIPLH